MALVDLSEGQIAFNGYVFNRAFILSDKSSDVSTDTLDIPFAPGIYVPQGKPGAKTFSVVGTIGGLGANVDSTGAQVITADNAQAELDRLAPLLYQGRAPFQWCLGTTNRWCYAQADKPKASYSPGSGYRTISVQMDFIADDPREYSYAQHSLQMGGGAAATNAGTFRAYPTITMAFSAATVNPTVQINPGAGGVYLGFTLNGTFQTTDSVVIVCDPRNRSISKNGALAWSLLALPVSNTVGNAELLPYLDPGDNTTYTSASSGTFTATMVWNDTWI